jgi:hypothetical protein
MIHPAVGVTIILCGTALVASPLIHHLVLMDGVAAMVVGGSQGMDAVCEKLTRLFVTGR